MSGTRLHSTHFKYKGDCGVVRVFKVLTIQWRVRDASQKFPINMESIPVEGFTLRCKNTSDKRQSGEIMGDHPEKVSPVLGTEGYIWWEFICFIFIPGQPM